MKYANASPKRFVFGFSDVMGHTLSCRFSVHDLIQAKVFISFHWGIALGEQFSGPFSGHPRARSIRDVLRKNLDLYAFIGNLPSLVITVLRRKPKICLDNIHLVRPDRRHDWAERRGPRCARAANVLCDQGLQCLCLPLVRCLRQQCEVSERIFSCRWLVKVHNSSTSPDRV